MAETPIDRRKRQRQKDGRVFADAPVLFHLLHFFPLLFSIDTPPFSFFFPYSITAPLLLIHPCRRVLNSLLPGAGYLLSFSALSGARSLAPCPQTCLPIIPSFFLRNAGTGAMTGSRSQSKFSPPPSPSVFLFHDGWITSLSATSWVVFIF